jgi:hypothetical protein
MGKNKSIIYPIYEDGHSLTMEEEKVPAFPSVPSDEEIQDMYFHWLTDGLIKQKEKSYLLLLEKLHTISFIWSVPNDDNRTRDGEILKQEFIEEAGLGLYELTVLYKRKCTVLEMLIGVSIRIDDIMDELEWTSSEYAKYWFWELVGNLGLLEYSDDRYEKIGGNVFVKDIVQNMMLRNYTREGNGGLFPLFNTKKDQRKVEIWYQMHEYLQERYKIDGGLV